MIWRNISLFMAQIIISLCMIYALYSEQLAALGLLCVAMISSLLIPYDRLDGMSLIEAIKAWRRKGSDCDGL